MHAWREAAKVCYWKVALETKVRPDLALLARHRSEQQSAGLEPAQAQWNSMQLSRLDPVRLTLAWTRFTNPG